MATELSVNVNAIAYLRNRRDLPWPSVVDLSRIALDAGAVGITVHPRPDERHIRRTDVDDLAALLSQPEYKDKEFNIEGYPDESFIQLVERIRPDQVTLVPDDPAQSTSDHGWDILTNKTLLENVAKRVKLLGMRLAIFVDPDPIVPPFAKSVGADRIEIFTGPYGAAHAHGADTSGALAQMAETAKAARDVGLEVNAGHDLSVANLPALLEAAPNIVEVSIGHGLTAEALEYGMTGAVRRFLIACGKT